MIIGRGSRGVSDMIAKGEWGVLTMIARTHKIAGGIGGVPAMIIRNALTCGGEWGNARHDHPAVSDGMHPCRSQAVLRQPRALRRGNPAAAGGMGIETSVAQPP